MKQRMRWLVGLGVLSLVLVLGVALTACGGSDGPPDAADTQDDATAHEEGDEHEADAHDDATSDEEGDEHDADAHEAGGDDAEANAYLEVAPKDALYLVKMTNFAFTPNVLEVDAGDVLEIAIQNVEPVLHDFTIDEIGADVHISYLGGTGEHAHAEPEREADVHFALTEPGSGVVHMRVYEPGEYVIYCTVPGHREAGMEGTLIVQ